jgi:hypothetical protein
MDESRFDELTKVLGAATPSRREALRRLMGGALAAVFGGLALEEVAAQDFGTEAYDLTCRGNNRPDTYCKGARPGDCGLQADGCVCAEEKRGKAVCVEQPPGGCPGRRDDCKRSSDCRSGELCIRVSACGCKRSGMCARACPR